ncbi:MAG: hypothetical protein ABIK28_10270, partial [Planctomycetota bacterium]
MMRNFACSFMIVVMLICAWGCSAMHDGLVTTCLRAENRTAPLGIDGAAPRLSWIVESSRRCKSQSANRILVA